MGTIAVFEPGVCIQPIGIRVSLANRQIGRKSLRPHGILLSRPARDPKYGDDQREDDDRDSNLKSHVHAPFEWCQKCLKEAFEVQI
jgi:hypothetical protein